MSYQPPPTPSDPQENTQANRASGSLQTTDLRPQQTHPHPLQYPPIYAGPSQPYISPYAQTSEGQPSLLPSAPESRPQYAPPPGPSSFNTISLGEASGPGYLAPAVPMSSYSSSSQEDSIYSSPGAQQYQVVTPGMLNDPRPITQSDKERLIRALRTHRVNTLTELRRVEKIFARLNSADVTEPMTSAWAHYVNSNNLLSELRGLTKSYPFSSECLDEAKWQVIGDPASSRSWNYCWLVLTKMQSQQLIRKHARLLAVKPAMWGGNAPTATGADQLAAACMNEWSRALAQMLRHWDSPPSTTGR